MMPSGPSASSVLLIPGANDACGPDERELAQ